MTSLDRVELLALWALASGGTCERPVRRRLHKSGLIEWNGSTFVLTLAGNKTLEASAPRCAWEPPKQQGPVQRQPLGKHARLALIAGLAALSHPGR